MMVDQGASGEEDEDFFASLPKGPNFQPRNQSRVIVHQPQSLEEAIGMIQSDAWIWRGQHNFSWQLAPRLARDFAQLPPLSDEPTVTYNYLRLENGVIGAFKEQARPLLHPVPDDLDLLGWLSVMQHYGAPTRLLDWSASPFIALWFAYEHPSEFDAALWGLNSYFCRREINGMLVPGAWDHLGIHDSSTTDAEGETTTRTPALEVSQRDRENEYVRWAIRTKCRWPLPVIPIDLDARMTAQQTVLTCIGDLESPVDQALLHYESWRSERAELAPPGGYMFGTDSTAWPLTEPADLLMKLRLRTEWRADALRLLNTMGINASTLFPGVDGVGRNAAMYFDIGMGSARETITNTFVL